MSKLEAYKNLIRQFYAGSLREESKANLAQYLEDPEFLDAWEQLMDEEGLDGFKRFEPDNDQLFDQIKSDLRIKEEMTRIPITPTITFKNKKSTLLAKAALILCIGVFSFLIWSNQQDVNSTHNRSVLGGKTPEIVLPGSERAQIVLESGEVIDLEKIKGDTLIDNGTFEILKLSDGSITYRMKDANSSTEKTAFNTIMTPRGGEYNLKLPDGTRVWLNAMTSLRYPIVFGKTTREIYLQGEAYFEVSTQVENGERIPFIIYTSGQKLEVLGTEFNLQNYGEDVITTLVEGKVKLNFLNRAIDDQYLTPAEQSIFNTKTNHVTKNRVDPYYFTAWKEGKFAFDKTSIEEVMTMISRWYDVEVIYHNKLENFQFSGTISRYEDLQKLLRTIELVGGIHFETEGRKVYVKN